jgi:L-threonylcarbamoyladenylate synthase
LLLGIEIIMPILPATDASIAQAAALLRTGKLVAFPTETVYGLGADATDGQAVAAIYAAKGRPAFNPLIIHVAERRDLDALIEWNDAARLLAAAFWPGALTLILPRRKTAPISLLASAGLDTLAVRIPSHPVARQLLRAVDFPLAAPSANASGRLSPTTAAHVAESLGDKVDLILDGGRSQVGVESTVVSLVVPEPIILRPGSVTPEQVAQILGRDVAVYESALGADNAPPSPGMLASHYAPHLPLRLNVVTPQENEAYLSFGADSVTNGAAHVNLSPRGDLAEAAANLFAMLRQLDKPTFSGIAVAPIPAIGLGLAINDRLRRAAVR